MTKLTCYTPGTPLARVVAPLVATAVSYLPPRALRPIAKPCMRLCRESRRRGRR